MDRLDQSLSLLVEMPIPNAWLAGDPLLGTLRGQVLKIPITGTVEKPPSRPAP